MATGQNPAFMQSMGTFLATSTAYASANLGYNNGDTVIVSNMATGNLYVWFNNVQNFHIVMPSSQRAIGVTPITTYVTIVLDAGVGSAYIERGYGAAR